MKDFEKDDEQIYELQANKKATVCIPMLVEYCADRMAELGYKTQIRRELSCIVYGEIQKKSGIPVQYMTQDCYGKIRKLAKALIRRRVIAGSEEAKSESLAYWERLLRNPDVPWAIKARARENLDKLLQLVEPEHKLVGDTKKTITLKELGLSLQDKKEALKALREKQDAVDIACSTADALLSKPLM